MARARGERDGMSAFLIDSLAMDLHFLSSQLVTYSLHVFMGSCRVVGRSRGHFPGVG